MTARMAVVVEDVVAEELVHESSVGGFSAFGADCACRRLTATGIVADFHYLPFLPGTVGAGCDLV